MLNVMGLTLILMFSTSALADGNLRNTAAEAVFKQFKVKQKVNQLTLRADCRWPADEPGNVRCELSQGKKSITLTGDAAVALRNDAVKAGAGEDQGAGSVSFREAQILNCNRTATIGYYTKKGNEKVWVKPGMEYSCAISAEPSVGPPPELDVVPPAGTSGP